MAQLENERRSGWQHMVAGGTAGVSAVFFLHPFDVIKTRLQVQDGVPGQTTSYKGTWDAARTIARQEGWKGLYAGLAPSLLGSGVSWGLYLYLYEHIKSFYRGFLHTERLTAGWNLMSAAQSGAMVCLVTNPIWLMKTRLALQRRAAPPPGSVPYAGMLDAVVRIGREEGWKGYYKGLGPSLVLQTLHGAIQFAVYEEMKHFAASHRVPEGVSQRELKPLEVSGYGALSKLVAATSTYPTQVIRSRLQQRLEGRSLVYTNSIQAALLTWQREGLRGFYKGLVPSLLRVMPQSAVTLMVYESLVKALSTPSSMPSSRSSRSRDRLSGAKASMLDCKEQDAGQQQKGNLSEQIVPLVIADSQAEQ